MTRTHTYQVQPKHSPLPSAPVKVRVVRSMPDWWHCTVYHGDDEVGVYIFGHEYVGERINALCFPYYSGLNKVVLPDESRIIYLMHKRAAAKLAVQTALTGYGAEWQVSSDLATAHVAHMDEDREWYQVHLKRTEAK